MDSFEGNSKWREKESTRKQSRLVHFIITKMLKNMNRGQTSDFIKNLLEQLPEGFLEERPTMNEEEYQELKEDLEKKKRSWKWKEDLK